MYAFKDRLCFICATLLFIFFPGPISALAQADFTAIATPQASAVFPVEHGQINLATGALHLEIPLEAYNQRGEVTVAATFVYDSGFWDVENFCGISCFQWEPVFYTDPPLSTGGWHLSYGDPGTTNPGVNSGPAEDQVYCTPPSGSTYAGAVTLSGGSSYTDPQGNVHEFISPSISVPSGCNPEDGNTYTNLSPVNAYASDGSGYYNASASQSGTAIFDKNGTLVYGGPQGDNGVEQSVLDPIDRNGNHLQHNSTASNAPPNNGFFIDNDLQDSLGRFLVRETVGAYSNNIVSTDYFDVLAPNGKTARYTVNYAQIPVNTSFNQPYPPGTPSAPSSVPEFTNYFTVITSITLPDGTAYTFSYDAGGYGELTGMTLPHGGSVSYSYGTAPGGLDPARPYYYFDHRFVKTHTGSDGLTTFAFQYQNSSPYSEAGQACPEVLNSAATSASYTAYTFSFCNGAILPKQTTFGTPNSSGPGAGQIDATVLYNYDLSHNCPNIGSSQYLACTGVIFRNLTAKTTVLSSPSSPSMTTDIQYGYNIPGAGAPTSTKQWDYYQAAPTSLPDSPPGNPTRQTDQTLGYVVNGANYPTLVTQKDVTGATVATTTYSYDEPQYFFPRSSSSPALLNQSDSLVTGNRGNLTTVSRCCAVINGQQTPVVTHFGYDDAGTIVGTWDPNQHETTFGYDPTDTFATSTTLPATGNVAHTAQTFFDSNTGVVIGQLDQNTQGTGYVYDANGRVTTEVFSNGQSPANVASLTYPSPNETDLTSYQNPGAAGDSKAYVDGFGRLTQSIQGVTSIETTYDPLGHIYTVANDHVSGSPAPTDGTTTYGYDELGRVHTVTSPKGEVTTYSYAVNTETITDPLNHSRVYTQDAFGDLTSVVEPDLSGAMDWLSSYSYDGLGRLSSISQKGNQSDPSQWRTRTFSYDGVGNLQSQSSPEQGTTTYCYDAASNLLSYLAAAPSTTPSCGASAAYSVQYTYDNDNRLQTKQVAGGTAFTYTYDGQDASKDPYGLGRLTGTTNGSNVQTLFTHDPAGRVNAEGFCLPSDCSFSYKVGAAYDFQDNLTSLTYPDGRQITWSYDPQNRIMGSTYASWNGNQLNLSFLSNLAYAPTGELTQANYAGFINYAAVYDPDENIAGLAYMSGTTTVTQKAYTWDPNGANLRTIQDSATGRIQSFNYDPLDRLASMSDSGSTANACVANAPSIPASSQTFSPDAWGNVQQSGSYNFIQSFDTSNRISASGYVYDPSGNGNLIQDGLGNNYQFNADGLMAGSNGSNYTYDALGQRVRKDGGATLEYFYFGGQLLATRDPGSGAWTDRLYGPGGVFGTVAGSENAIAQFRLVDHLGSLAGIFNPQTGSLTAANSLPYGQTNLNPTNDIYPFTDHDRDGENGSDATLFRHYSPQQGRWLSPDPYNGSLDLTDPQSFNRYAYLSNRPLAAVDQYGLCGDDDDDDDDCGSPSGGDSGIGSVDQSGQDGSESPVTFDTLTGAAYAQASLVYGDPEAALSAQNIVDSALSGISTTLDVIGLIPELGTFANGANALIQLSQGHTAQAIGYATGAVLSAFAIPGGSALAKGGEVLRAAEILEETADAGSVIREADAAATEGVYTFRSSSGRMYVGQSADIPTRLSQHIASGKLLTEDLAGVGTIPVPGGKTAREVEEQFQILQRGGVENLENIRNPIGAGRANLLPQSAKDRLGYK